MDRIESAASMGTQRRFNLPTRASSMFHNTLLVAGMTRAVSMPPLCQSLI